ncbi:hypothetical protein D3C76_1873640 [compost metagenome]
MPPPTELGNGAKNSTLSALPSNVVVWAPLPVAALNGNTWLSDWRRKRCVARSSSSLALLC